eukprot:TRINITY_DN1984_c0_g2_i1.p1 TRINITY_DN1984_c0_g2~~TRINITY_DN1984_c0_g2_i1.p1  ORF type:complete len:861 (-),score=245.93 TRINITY_DN1984_c0_g2_i1:206-2788(-)
MEDQEKEAKEHRSEKKERREKKAKKHKKRSTENDEQRQREKEARRAMRAEQKAKLNETNDQKPEESRPAEDVQPNGTTDSPTQSTPDQKVPGDRKLTSVNSTGSMSSLSMSLSGSEEWQEQEKSIMSASNAKAKWLEMEKEQADAAKSQASKLPEKSAGVTVPISERKKMFLAAMSASKTDVKDSEDDEKERPAIRIGNVFQFLQQKQKEVRAEQTKEVVDEPEQKAQPSNQKAASPPKLEKRDSTEFLPAAPPVPGSFSLTLSQSSDVESPSLGRKKDMGKEEKKQLKALEKQRKEEKRKEEKISKEKEKRASLEPQKRPSSTPREPTVLHEYVSADPRILSISKGKPVKIVDKNIGKGWWKVEFEGKTGYFPAAYINVPVSGPRGFLEFSADEGEELEKSEFSLQEGGVTAGQIPDLKKSVPIVEDVTTLDQRVERFEEPDSANNIVFKTDEDGKSNIRGATIEKLLQRATYDKAADTDYVAAFLLTYTSFTTASVLFELLILRFKTPKPESMDEEVFKKTKQLPIRLRVFNFLKLWIKQDFPALKDNGLIPKIKEFANVHMAKVMPGPAKEILTIIATKEEEKSGGNDIFVSKKPPKPFLPKKSSGELTLQDLHPEEVARQLTLIERDLFKAIQPHECNKQKWLKENKSLTPNIHKLINRFNQVSMWVASEVVKVEDLKLRAVILNRFIFVAQKCLELNNYNAVMEILSALNCSAVHRLRQTWELLPPKSVEVFDELVNLMDPEGNFANYRDALKKARPPIVPYLGLTLTDLVFISEGNPDILPDTPDLINWWKLNLIASIIKEMQHYQETPYNLEKVDSIQTYLLSRSQVFTEEELYQMSIQREERTARRRRKLNE